MSLLSLGGSCSLCLARVAHSEEAFPHVQGGGRRYKLASSVENQCPLEINIQLLATCCLCGTCHPNSVSSGKRFIFEVGFMVQTLLIQ